jgi:hypothetical protein
MLSMLSWNASWKSRLAFQPEVQAGFVLLMLALAARTLVELGKEVLWSLS